MAGGDAGVVLRQLCGLLDAGALNERTDAELLERFAARGEEEAFAALLRRHGRLVWGVCQRLLRHRQDAEDAFQATFLVLARKAGSVRKAGAVASWLYGTARRISLKARKRSRQRQTRERQGYAPRPEEGNDLAWRELQAILDEEVERLPARYRAAFVLCCLEGRTRGEAARELNCTDGTLSSRLARARQLLRQRLARRGVSFSAALCAGELWGQGAAARVPAALAAETLRSACGSAAGSAAGTVTSAAVRELADGAVRAGVFSLGQAAGVLLLGLGLLGAGVAAWGGAADDKPGAAGSAGGRSETAAPAEKDVHGDPLPRGAVARLGTLRQRAPGGQVAVTADGKEVVTLGGTTVRRFDALTGELLAVRRLPREGTLSPRGTFALAVFRSEDGNRLELWDVNQGKLVRAAPVGDHSPWGVSFSDDERRVALADSDRSNRTHRVLVWDIAREEPRPVWSERMKIPDRYFDPIAVLSPDGRRLVGCHLDRKLRCWDVASGRLLWEAEELIWSPFVRFSPGGKQVVTMSNINRAGIRLYDAATGKVLPVEAQPPEEAVYPVGFSPGGRFLAFEDLHDHLVLWKPGEKSAAFRLPPTPPRRGPTPYTLNRVPNNFAFTPDGKGLIRRSGTLQRWDLATGRPVYPDTAEWGHTEEVTRLIFSPDGKRLASKSKDGTARVWDVATSRPLHRFPTSITDYLAFSTDGRHLLVMPFGADDFKLRKWDVATGRAAGGYTLPNANDTVVFGGDRELRVTADGRKVIMLAAKKGGMLNRECVLTVWDAATGECLSHREAPWGRESCLTPDGTGVFTYDSKAGEVRLLDLDTAAVRARFPLGQPAGREWVMSSQTYAVSADGRILAARMRHRNLRKWVNRYDFRVWDVASGRELLAPAVEGEAEFALSSDGRLFALASAERLRLWETASCRPVGDIPAPDRDAVPPGQAFATALAVSPDGRTIATGHADSTILLWDATLRGGVRGGPLTPAGADALWADLAGADARRAYAALWRLADDPERSLPLLRRRLRPVTPAGPEVLRPLLRALDSSRFGEREAAERELRTLGDRARPDLLEALGANPSAEQRRRIEAVLAGWNRHGPLEGEALREVRAVQVLERIASAGAREFLEELAGGMESARLTREAKAALRRMEAR